MYNGSEYLERHNDDVYGFIYVITYEDEDGNLYSYYGKRAMIYNKKYHFGKKQLATMTDKRLKTYENRPYENMGWKSYVGSCKDTNGYIPTSKYILQFASSKRELTWLELKIMVLYGAIEDPK